MNIGFWCREDQINNNNIFNNIIDPTGGSGFKKYNDLYNYCKRKNININIFTVDTAKNIKKIDVIVFIGFPEQNTKYGIKFLKLNKPKILIHEECRYIEPKSYLKSNLDLFDVVLTFDDNLIKSSKFKKFQIASLERHNIKKKNFNKKKLACMLNANKKLLLNNNLYSERLKVIKWYEKKSLNDFDLYGSGWDEFVIPWNLKFLNKFNYPRFLKLRKILNFYKKKNWKGFAYQRINTIRNYKFFFVIENFRLNGYITTKIFDAFYAKTIPIYLGAYNIKKYIPENCFIDYSKFKNLNDLHCAISSMKEEEYNSYIKNANLFLNSKFGKAFESKNFIKTLLTSFYELNK